MTQVVKFFKGRDGRPIARLGNGKVVLPARGFNPQVEEEWEVELEERERYCIAHPIRRIETQSYELSPSATYRVVKSGNRMIRKEVVPDERRIVWRRWDFKILPHPILRINSAFVESIPYKISGEIPCHTEFPLKVKAFDGKILRLEAPETFPFSQKEIEVEIRFRNRFIEMLILSPEDLAKEVHSIGCATQEKSFKETVKKMGKIIERNDGLYYVVNNKIEYIDVTPIPDWLRPYYRPSTIKDELEFVYKAQLKPDGTIEVPELKKMTISPKGFELLKEEVMVYPTITEIHQHLACHYEIPCVPVQITKVEKVKTAQLFYQRCRLKEKRLLPWGVIDFREVDQRVSNTLPTLVYPSHEIINLLVPPDQQEVLQAWKELGVGDDLRIHTPEVLENCVKKALEVFGGSQEPHTDPFLKSLFGPYSIPDSPVKGEHIPSFLLPQVELEPEREAGCRRGDYDGEWSEEVKVQLYSPSVLGVILDVDNTMLSICGGSDYWVLCEDAEDEFEQVVQFFLDLKEKKDSPFVPVEVYF